MQGSETQLALYGLLNTWTRARARENTYPLNGGLARARANTYGGPGLGRIPILLYGRARARENISVEG